MAADGEDFARRKPLYRKVYHLSKNGDRHDEAAARIVSLYSTYWKEWESFASLRSSSSQLALSS